MYIDDEKTNELFYNDNNIIISFNVKQTIKGFLKFIISLLHEITTL